MFEFDKTTEPPTTGEIQQEKARLLALRKKLLIHCATSDIAHVGAFALIYFFNLVSGRSLIGVLIFSSMIALMLAARIKTPIERSDRVQVTFATCAVMATSYLFLTLGFKEALVGSGLATLGCGSIVAIGSILGHRAKAVFRSIEDLNPLIDDARAKLELQLLSRSFSEVSDYRQSASNNLRPNLTYGELAAMKHWVAKSGYQFSAEGLVRIKGK